MAVLLVDTNIINYAYGEHSLWQDYAPLLEGQTLLVAAQSIAELRFGAKLKNWGERKRKRLEILLINYTVIYPNDDICTAWANVKVQSHQQGQPIRSANAWIAATALAFEVPLVTHNKKDFEFIEGLELK